MSYQPLQVKKIKQRTKIRGSALLVALFVIIIMTLLGGAILKMQMTSSETIAQEVLGTRALAAARTGMQIKLYKLLPLDLGISSGSSNNCTNSTYSQLTNISGLQQCKAIVTCENYANHDGVAYYRVVSTGECGSGTMANDSKDVVLSSRTIQVEARRL